MKIKAEHYAVMREKIAALPVDRVENIRRTVHADPRVKDAQKRFRWDLSHAAGVTPFVCEAVYPYADDTHIDTALRSITRELNLTI